MASLPPFSWGTTLRAADVLAFCQQAATFLRAVSNLRMLDGHFLTVSFDAIDGVNVRHSLGRPYLGVFVVNSTDAVHTPMITCLVAADAAATGIDPAEYVSIGAETAWTGTVTLWVF